MTRRKKEVTWASSFSLLIVGLGILIIWALTARIANWFITLSGMELEQWQNLGTFGDSFGFINALFSGLAFLGVIWAIMLQKRELQLQREELEETRGELRGQREQLEKQNEFISRQTFENTFFHLLSLHRENLNSFYAYNKFEKKVLKGLSAFQSMESQFSKFFHSKYTDELSNGYNGYLQEIWNLTKKRYNEIYLNDNYLGPYLSNLLCTIDFIDKSQIKQKQFYVNLVIAILSKTEKMILFYHFYLVEDEGEFKHQVEKYGILDRLHFEEESPPSMLKTFYTHVVKSEQRPS